VCVLQSSSLLSGAEIELSGVAAIAILDQSLYAKDPDGRIDN
jgi:hypothetical protein